MKTLSMRRRIWTVPLMIGVISLVGLISALQADGVGDVLSWIALAIPVAVAIGFSLRRSSMP